MPPKPDTTPTAIAIAVVEHNDRFLVGQRPAGKPLAGFWQFPGGRIEAGETAELAAARECFEETGIAVEVVGAYPSHVHVYQHGVLDLRFFACRAMDPDQTPLQPFCWVQRRELGGLKFPEGNRELLQHLQAEGDR